jgi:hypothetical protein
MGDYLWVDPRSVHLGDASQGVFLDKSLTGLFPTWPLHQSSGMQYALHLLKNNNSNNNNNNE